MTKKEALKNAIKAIVLKLYHLGIDRPFAERMPDDDEFWDRKANEILKEMEIRFPIGD